MEFSVLRQPFDRSYFSAIRLNSEDRARFHSVPVQQHRAGTAQRRLTSDVRAGELALVSKKMREQRPGLDLMFLWSSVDFDFNETFHEVDSVQVRCDPVTDRTLIIQSNTAKKNENIMLRHPNPWRRTLTSVGAPAAG
jgi:hypothetical protein